MPTRAAIDYGIPDGIKAQHVKRAAAEADRDGTPANRKSDRFDVLIGGDIYAPKYIISLAAKYAFGTELPSTSFHAHQAIKYLGNLQFKIVDRASTSNQVISVEDDESAFPEGRAIFKLHRSLERDPQIARKAKEKRLREAGKLECEVCDFDFAEHYGPLGQGFIEAHHMTPVSELNGEVTTKIKDLALVCSNCHRMLHRGKSVEQLRSLTRKRT